ncbi:Endoplasmic reticulum zinc transporter [Mycoblastus sanguinarius]|nr:Endoplasmic reticulum zinc transporter [Mycoblastus sanguinarius]
MASDQPTILLPPRTPSPSPKEDHGLNGFMNSPARPAFDSTSLSPMDENFPVHRHGSTPAFATTTLPLSPADPNSLNSPMSIDSSTSYGSTLMVEDSKGVFNFQPAMMAKAPVTKSSIGQRRGHKYKHSSVSHQFFLEPEPRAPLALPNSLPIPTLKECQKSMSREQQSRFWWSICHMAVAAYTLWSAEGSLALTALSHLILFDSLGAMLCVVVDILGNFEVWKRSSIRHPFGLERAEVLAGFAMSVLLFFMGLDLISHNLQHLLEGLGEHEPHHSHDHERVSAGEVDSAALLAIVSTLISALGLGNHARIGKAMRFAYIESLPSILGNPSHFLTISCSMLLLLLPLLSIRVYLWLDRALSTTIALSMCILGFRLVKTLGFMLLMSYDSGNAVNEIMRDVESDPSVTAIEGAKFWQVHYGLCMACLTLRVRGTDEGLTRLRDRVSGLVKSRLGGGYGGGGTRWEVSVQFDLDRF